jgi:2-oxoglutarate dehydrogenase E2 component (dihydrolipoamide succinyltransferase)
MSDIVVPTLGESVTTATVARWLKKAGERVAADEPVVELETDKVTVEVNAPSAGVMEQPSAQEGDEVEVGTVLGSIGASEGSATPPSRPETETSTAGVHAPAPATGPVSRPAEPQPAAGQKHQPAAGQKQQPAAGHAPMPSAAKIMEERGVSADAIADGTGKDGRITKGDVLAFLDRKPAPPAPAATPAPKPAAPRAPDAREERVKMTRLRRTIAQRLKEAQNTAAMLTTFNEVDMSAVMALRSEYKEAFEKKHGGVRLGFMSFFVRACVAALHEYPAVNAEIDGEDIVYKNYVHMGIAVGGPNGLVVPVLRDAQGLSFADIEKAIAGMGRRAKDGQLKLEELTGGSFSITNGGTYGSLMSTPILNPPQSAILGMHKIQDRPMAVNGKIEIRPMMYLALSYDHRIIDGKEAVSFLVRVKEGIEDPRRLLLGL